MIEGDKSVDRWQGGCGLVRLLVFGSRTWADRAALWITLSGTPRTDVLIEGEARGADRMAKQWAQFYRVPLAPFPVDHSKDGPWPAAGHRRNRRMHNQGKPTDAVGFISGKRDTAYSRGSQGMADICKLASTYLRIIRDDGEEQL